MVWLDETGEGRMQVGYFRKDVMLAAAPKAATLHLFADSRYVLVVNGTTLGTGPVRFYPEKPFYDTYDLRPYLQKGQNTIAVKVLSQGMHTFQTPRSPGGFTAWGEITEANGGRKPLAVPTGWRCRRAEGYDAHTPKMTFALGAMEVFDARRESDDWLSPDAPANGWHPPVVLQDQAHWGKLNPRPIPFLTQSPVAPQFLLGTYALDDSEEIYSFRLQTPDRNRDELQQRPQLLGYTYIFSPRDQAITVGLWWGDYYLNGEKLAAADREPDPHRLGRANWQPYVLPLKKGWNQFVASGQPTFGTWEFYLSVDRKAGLRLSPDKKDNDTTAFRTAPALAEGDYRDALGKLLAAAAGSPGAFVGSWRAQPRQNPASSPVMDIAWRRLGAKHDFLPQQTENLTLADSVGTALLYDFGGKQLGRVFIEYDAPAGTSFDLGFSEDTLGDKAFVLKRAGMLIGAKHIASGTSRRFETLSPYGLRFLQVNVTGNQGKPVTIRRVGLVSETYPLEKRGSFACSDPLLNEIWELGWRTLQVCAEDTYIDTPFRERGLYAGDAVPEYGMTLVTDGGSQLLRHSLVTFEGMYAHLFETSREADENFTFGAHDDYPLLALQALMWYVTRTNDLAYARTAYPKYAQLLRGMNQHRDANGFYLNQMRPFIEWTTIDKDASPLAPLQILWAQGLRDMATLAGRLGRPDEAARYEKQRTELVRAINQTFWDAEKGAYFDGFKEGKKLATHFPITGAMAVLYGISGPDRTPTILDYLEKEMADIGTGSRRQKTSTYGSFYVLEALYRHGRAGAAEDFIRKHWSPMIFKHNDTAWENFDDYGIGTLSHAWSGHPTYLLSTQVLGVNLEYPDADAILEKITIAPQSERVSWAEGEVPHPKGLVKVSWKAVGDNLFVSVKTPPGLAFEVAPKGRLGRLALWVNGVKREGGVK